MSMNKKKSQKRTTKKARPRAKTTSKPINRKVVPQQAQQRGSKVPKRSQCLGTMVKRSSTGEFVAKQLTLPDGRVMASVQMMARGVGVGAGHLSKVMNGKRNVSLHLAHRWAGFLGVSLDVLYAVLYGPGGVVPVESPVGRDVLPTLPISPAPTVIPSSCPPPHEGERIIPLPTSQQ